MAMSTGGNRSVRPRLGLAELDRPARVAVFVRELGRPGLPILRNAPLLDGCFLRLRVALLGRRDERGVDDLSAHGDIAGLAQRRVEPVEQRLEARTGRKDERSEFLLDRAKDVRNAPPEARAQPAQYYAEAAGMLAERSGFFDPRRRGTVIENRLAVIRALAMRLLTLGREADAFAAFESVRARGLSELALAMGRPDVGADDRRWLAELLVIEARSSEIEHKIVAELVASGRLDAQADRLQALEQWRAQRQAKLKANEATRARFDVPGELPSVTLDALRAAAADAGVPVLLYWTTDVNVIAWYVGPEGSDVRTVLLPAYVLEEKVRRFRGQPQPWQQAVRRNDGAGALSLLAVTVRRSAQFRVRP